jgi:mannosyl-oligosaccharide alpha-1,2-mannosidase
MRSLTLLSTLAGAYLAAAVPTRDPPSYAPPSEPPGYEPTGEGEPAKVAARRAAAVKEAFQFAWDGYYQLRRWMSVANWLHTDRCRYAFPNDELRPVNNSFANSRNGWGASAADALSTAIIMEIPSIVRTVVNYVPSIDWSVSYDDMSVSLFETTIRYLGGLLSGYDLLNGPFSHLVRGKAARKVPVLLDQAINLANNLSYAFDTSTGIPHNNLFFSNRSNDGASTNGLATIGTLVLEWTRLSDLSGDETYGQLAQKGESYLLHPRPVCRAHYTRITLALTLDRTELGSAVARSCWH